MATVLAKIRQTTRFLSIFGIIFSFFLVNSIVWLIFRDRWKRTYVWSVYLSFLARCLLWVMDGKVNSIGVENYHKAEGALLAGNHVSYMDVIVIASTLTTCFVTSVEIKETPGLGQLCIMAGCLFVERRNRASLQKEIGELQEGLDRHMTVTIFPEATSTNAEQILRFRRPLFLSAIHARRTVIPICINYRKVGGEALSLSNRDSICWYGDMPFLPHLWKLCGLGKLEADLNFLEPLKPNENEDARDLAAKSEAAVKSIFRPIQ